MPTKGQYRAANTDPVIDRLTTVPPTLATSRFVPGALPVTHVPRNRLLDQLDVALRHPVTLVAAPAGWGKSVLLSSWAASRAAGPVAWVGFEAGDGFRAWHHVVESLTRAGVPYQSDDPARGGTDRAGPPAVLVLDDLHLVTDRAVLGNVERLLRRCGSQLRVVILARNEPALPLYRWRLTGQLAELHTDQLSFTPEETTQLLRRHDLDVPRATLRRLLFATEGWAAGLTLAARTICWHHEPDRVVDELGGRDHAFGDYFEREVLDRLPVELREMLLCTSVLEYVCPGLVEALTDRRDGARILGELERANAFVVHCGGPHGWYRYRRLLRRSLDDELRRWSPERIPALHAAASGWYARNGLPAEALRHALAAADWEGAKRLLKQHWRELLTGCGPTSPIASEPAPPDSVTADAWLAVAFAVQRHDGGDLDGMRAFLRRAEQASDADDELGTVLCAAHLAEARMCLDADRTLTAAARMLDAARGGPPAVRDEVRALALTATAAATLALGQVESSELALREALPLARRSGSGRGYVTALRQQALVDLVCGRLGCAAHGSQVILGAVSKAGHTQVGEIMWARLILGSVCIARGRLDEAAYHLNHGTAGAGHADPGAWAMAALSRSRLHQLSGDPARGLDTLAEAWVDIGAAGIPQVLRAPFALMEAELRLSLGDIREAGRLVSSAIRSNPLPDWTAVVTAKVHLANGEATAATAAVAPSMTGRVAPSLHAVEACLLHAYALRALGDRVASGRFLERCLQMATVEGLRQPFLLNATLVHDMLVSHLAAGTSYPATIVDVTGATAGRSGAAPTPRPAGVDPLTERELIVLRHLRSMMSTAEIASMLCVSANTVKTHVKNVYRKLGVGRRRDAIRRAQEVGLL